MKDGVVVEIWKRGLLTDSGIRFLCESARITYDERKVVMEGVKQVETLQGSGLLVSLSVEDGNLVVVLLPITKYVVYIGKQDYPFPKMIED